MDTSQNVLSRNATLSPPGSPDPGPTKIKGGAGGAATPTGGTTNAGEPKPKGPTEIPKPQ